MNKSSFLFSKNLVSIEDDFIMYSDINRSHVLEYPIHAEKSYIIFCLEGSAEIEINLEKRVVSKNEIVLISLNSIVFHREMSDDFRVAFFSVSKNITEELLNYLRKYPPVFLLKPDFPSIMLTDEEMEEAMRFFQLMWNVVEDVENDHRTEMLKHLLCALLIKIHGHASKYMNNTVPISRKEEMVRQFFLLVSEYLKESKDVSFYANKLCVSPKYLSSLVKQAIGKPAKECIDYCVVLESKLMLRSSCTIQEISQELNFPNQSFFGKYFKKHTGVSPLHYRRSILKQ
ncbi:AraC-type DNA-binding protein [Bacteroides luti]|uniref:AraC-type DNA-binding protein n=1 Tax=Bacteroides luti TaxID=1297750 RepID=A0A1M5CS35_9BACE|nr:helix-turn-helix domain-containing protein [Bacteroides luti]SHF57530.1 AraC-type DNA-binding protein [Bacteroides luti]